MNRIALLLLCCLLLTGCGATATNQTAASKTKPAYSLGEADALPFALRVPLERQGDYLLVAGSINGQHVGDMLFDTGSTLNIIDKGLISRLRLEKVGGGQTVGIAGTEPFSVHRVDSLAIAGLDLGVDRAASLSMYKLTRGMRDYPVGLIGSISLLPHPFVIDYEKSELLIYNRDRFVPPKDAQKVRLEFYGRLPAVRATLANGREVLLIIDTGMDAAVALPMELSREPGVLATGASGGGAATGVGGRIQTKQGWLKSLNVFGYRLSSVPVVFEPTMRTPRRTDLPVGRIGGQLLQGFRLTFDARYSALWASFASPVEDER